MRSIQAVALTACAAVLLVAPALMAGLPEYQAAVQAEPSLISYYTFDGANAADMAAHDPPAPHDGTLAGTTAFVTGVGGAGQALSVTGSGFVNCGVAAEFAFADDSIGTVEAWIQPAGTGNGVFAACRDGGSTRYSLHTEGGVYTNIWTGLNWSNSPATFSAGTWRHVVYVFKGSEYETYIDGRFVPNRGGNFSLGVGTGLPFLIGSSSAAGAERWNGLIDEVAVYADALTADQVLEHFSKISTSVPIKADPLYGNFFTPTEMGPVDVTLSLVGAVGAAGGTPLTLTYTSTVIAVTTADETPVAIPTGGTVIVPEGESSVVVKVSPASPVPAAGGTSSLTAAGTGLLSVTSRFAVKVPPAAAMLSYQAAVRAEPSLISYYTFDDDTGMTIKDVAHPGDPGGVKHDGRLDGATTPLSLAPTAGTHPGGSALQLDAHGLAYFGPVGDFEFSDGTGTIEMWVRTTSSANYNRVLAAMREGAARWGVHGNPSANTFGSWNGSSFLTVGSTYDPNIWYHLAYVYDVSSIHVYVNGVFAGDLNHGLVGTTGLPVMLGAPTSWSNYGNTTNNERFAGQLDEVAIYADPLPAGSILAHFLELQPVVTMTPDKRFFTTPADMGPVTVSLGFSGASGGTGGTPITVTYNEAVISVTTAADVAIPSGSTVLMPQSAASVDIKVAGLGIGSTDLVASVTNFLSATGQFSVRTAASTQLLTYQSTVLAEPSLISYYTFDTEPSSVLDRAPETPTPLHDGTFSGMATLAPRADVGGGALELTGLGHVNFGAISDFTFADDTGSVEFWLRPGWAVDGGSGDRVIAASRDADVRYSIHLGAGRRYINSFTGNSWGWAIAPFFEDRWYHVAFVYDNDRVFRCYVDGVLYASQYDTGYPTGPGGHMALGPALDQTFQIGSSSSGGRERFIGGIDEVAVYEDALTDAQVLAHYQTMALGLTPNRQEFLLPAEAGPAVVTLSRPAGSAGDVPVTLTFDTAIVAVDAGSGPMASGSIVTIPSGQPAVALSVTALSEGATTLTAAADGFATAHTLLPVRLLNNQTIMIVDDHFDDNPLSDPNLYYPAILTNLAGPGGGFYYLPGEGVTKTQQEAGTEWQVLTSGGDFSRALISSNEAGEVAVMTPAGVGVEWTISNVGVTTDNTGSLPQFVGGELADCYHQLGLVSADRVNNGNNEMYSVNSAGGLFVNVFYERNTSENDLIVTGNVRAVNKTKVGSGDLESVEGLETLATFTLTGVTSITAANPLLVSLKANQSGWSVGFAESAGAEFAILPAALGVHIGPGGRLAGGWDASSLNDAAITDEFDHGAFATAQLQNTGAGRGYGSIDRIRVCIGCDVVGDCPNPFADADRDADVDLADFAFFQACYTGVEPTLGPGCSCFNQDGIPGIGVGDWFAFTDCFSGPSVVADKSCDD